MPIASALESLSLTHPPVAVAFLDEAPSGLPHVDAAAAASCGYWKLASEGRAFYTTADDHQNCPVGAFTHGVVLSPAKREELQSLIGIMGQLQYLRVEEVPGIPHRASPLRVAAYAPLDQAVFRPDAVIFRGTPKQIMLLSEAARAAGAFDTGAAMGRPTCAMLPHALDTGVSVASLGCIGNRVYTALGDDELYLAVPGPAVDRMLEQLGTIVSANDTLQEFHRERAATLGAGPAL
jgi:uncharacterized protein (DUF169 family)